MDDPLLYLNRLGLSPEVSRIYLTLYQYGAQSISELARHSGIERTHIYRLLDDIKASGMVEVEVRYKRHIFRAAPVSNAELLLAKREAELRSLRTDLSGFESLLGQPQLRSGATRVQAYHGADGIKQMLWNQTKSRSENLSILYDNMQLHTGLTFFERWVRQINGNGITARSVFGENFVRSQHEWYGRRHHDNERIAAWQGRYLAASVFPITHSVIIFDDVTAFYNWQDGAVFGIELHNQQIADTQRHFFELLWNQGVSVDDLDPSTLPKINGLTHG